MFKLLKLWLNAPLRPLTSRKSRKNKLSLGVALAVAALCASLHGATASSAPKVDTKEGTVKGFFTEGIAEFLGIPYAAPPIGDLRWRPPVSHAHWSGVREATAFGPECAQIYELGAYGGLPNNNEDCLYLNVYTSAGSNGNWYGDYEKLPVLMFIHGSCSAESGDDYDGSKIALQGHTVVVTINYRLNLFGYLAHPALDNEGHHFANYGILDHQFALKWIKKNIAKFGGDPNNVTVSGQSCGAQSATAELLSPLATGLFNKAILQSGVAYVTEDPLNQAEQTGINFAVAAGCGSGTGPSVANCLRSLPAAKIAALAGNGIPYYDHGVYAGDTGSSAYVAGAVADGQILPTDEVNAIKTGRFNHAPILAGSTKNEYDFQIAPIEFYERPRAPLTEAQEQAYVTSTFSGNAGPDGSPPAYPPGTVAAVNAEYPLSAYPSAELQWTAVETDSGKSCRLYDINPIWAKQVPFYSYEFLDQTAPDYFPALPGFVTLAYHTGDIQYLFPLYRGGALGIAHPLNSQQTVLSDQIVAAWTNFMWTGNPNGSGNKPWPRYKAPDFPWFTENLRSSPPVIATTYSPPITLPPTTPAGLSTETNDQFSAEHHCAFWDKYLQYGP